MESESSRPTERIFLSAEWRDLLMLNYETDAALLRSFVPRGSEIDSFAGRTYVSLVGFRFLRTKLLGLFPIPFHTNFDEINLRFYVRRESAGEIRRGVVFIREIVPRRAIASIARIVYGENYVALPMRHRIQRDSAKISAEYQFRIASAWYTLRGSASGDAAPPQEGSLEQFITEHYWGYTAGHQKPSLEYHVTHVPWRVWSCSAAAFEGDASALYGSAFAEILRRPPASAFLADGSPVLVHSATRIR
ncbi:MAG TPA: DUF2071 domain-containing protein [Candidatus Limnocylindrales bacterium]|nr:DUF2071 domain-containing protein [Candidatus Limnocylindrales bacterium]